MNPTEIPRSDPMPAQDAAGSLNQALLAAIVEMEILKRKEYLTEEEAAKLYSLPAATLRTDRCRGRGPRFVKKGRKVLYKKTAILKVSIKYRSGSHHGVEGGGMPETMVLSKAGQERKR